MTKLPTMREQRDKLYAEALAKHNGNTEQAALAIGVHFTTLYRWKSKKAACKALERVQ